MIATRRSVFVLLAALTAFLLIGGGASYVPLYRHNLQNQAEENRLVLNLAVESLRAALDRYAPLPALIAERPILVDALTGPMAPRQAARLNEDLRQTSQAIRASDVFVMDISGRVIAAGSYQSDERLIGRNFSDRTFFTQALNGDLASFQVHGTTKGEQGYFYAAPVEKGDKIIGVLAVEFDIEAFQSVWRGTDLEFLLLDRNDFVVMASRPQWHFRALRRLSRETTQAIANNMRYEIDRIELLPVTRRSAVRGVEILQFEGRDERSYVTVFADLPERGWRMASLSPSAPAHLATWRTLLNWALAAALALIALARLLFMRVEQTERGARALEARERLQRAVSERTADLEAALHALQSTQADLVHAGKMAGLGQISAALSHELNQPLSAVKTYADNARIFLERSNLSGADENLARISGLADRMARISANLRNFARRPQQSIGPVSLPDVVRDAIAMIELRLKAEHGRVECSPPDHDIRVMGGHLRLQQVVVNLINNALDAMEGQPDPVVTLTYTASGLQVRDTGPGIEEGLTERIFDPFYTSKPAGKGLGLGLSICYNIVSDFGGRLEAHNHSDGGAVFTLWLRPAASGDETS